MSREMVSLEGRVIFSQPAVNRSHNSLSLITLIGRLFSVAHLRRWAQTLGFVWAWCEYLTSCFPLHAKSAKMEPLRSEACLPAIAALIASSPKQRVAWCLRLAMEALSLESWKQWTPPVRSLHLEAAQAKKWHGWPSWYWRVTSGLKNAYIGEHQDFLSASEINVISIAQQNGK